MPNKDKKVSQQIQPVWYFITLANAIWHQLSNSEFQKESSWSSKAKLHPLYRDLSHLPPLQRLEKLRLVVLGRVGVGLKLFLVKASRMPGKRIVGVVVQIFNLPHLCFSPMQSYGDKVLTCYGAIFYDGTLTPRQGVLEGLEKVKDAPAYDHIVVEPNKQADLAKG